MTLRVPLNQMINHAETQAGYLRPLCDVSSFGHQQNRLNAAEDSRRNRFG
jgi:hypothetical protein